MSESTNTILQGYGKLRFSGKVCDWHYFKVQLLGRMIVKFPDITMELVNNASVESAKEHKAWLQNNGQRISKKLQATNFLYSQIVQSISKDVYDLITAPGEISIGDGITMYYRMYRAYGQANGDTLHAHLALVNLKQGEKEKISTLVSRFHRYHSNLSQCFPVKLQVSILLNALNTKFNSFVIQARLTMDSLPEDYLIEKLITQLLSHERTINTFSSTKETNKGKRSKEKYRNASKELCRNFQKGRCKRGSDCRYIHKTLDNSGIKSEEKKRNRTPGTCFAYANKGFCSKGNECQWSESHIKAETNLLCTFSITSITATTAFMDSGANRHTLRYKPRYATNIKICNEQCKTADGTVHQATHTMDVGPLLGVFLIPTLQANLISVSSLQSDNPQAHITVGANGMTIQLAKNHHIFAKLVDGLYVIDIDRLIQANQHVVNHVNWVPQGSEEATRHFHESIGHSSIKRFQANKQYYTKELPTTTTYFYCNPCKLSKHKHRTNHNCSSNRPDQYLEALSADFSGTNGQESAHRDREWLVVTDQRTGYKWVFTAHTQPKAITKMHVTMNIEMNRTGRKIQRLRVDNASILNDGVNKGWCREHSIAITPTIAGNHNQNGIAERAIQSIQTVARTCLLSSKAPSNYWHHALQYATWTLNRLPNARNKDNAPSVIAAGMQSQIDLTKFHPFYAPVSVRKINNELARGNKLEARGFAGNFLYNLQLGMMVVVDGKLKKRDQVIFLQPEQNNISLITEDDSDEQEEQPQSDEQEEEPQSERPKRNPRPVLTFDELQQQREYLVNNISLKTINTKQRQAKAVLVELNNHRQNNSFTIVEDPGPQTKKIRSMFIFKDKYNGDTFLKTKARMVLCGNQQCKDNIEVFAPVVDPMCIKILCILSLVEGYEMSSADVTAAFLYSLIDDKDIYFYPPPQMKLPRGKVCRVNKGIYGLVQAPKLWYQHLSLTLVALGFTRSTQDSCLFYNKNKTIILAFHVDDILILSKHKHELEELRTALKRTYKITFTELDYFLSLRIQREQHTITVSDIQRILNMKEKHCPDDNRVEKIPILPGIKNEERNDLENKERPMVKETQYRSILGELNYIATKTRPDIAQAVTYLQRFQTKPTETRYKEALRIVRYLYNTRTMTLKYRKGKENTLSITTDSDWAGDLIKSRSTSGIIIRYRNNLIYWKSRKQSTVASSTCAAELIAAKQGIDESVYILKLLKELDLVPTQITLNIDNQAAQRVLQAPHNTTIKKYLKIKIDALQEKVSKGYLIHGINIGKLNIKYIPSQENEADLQTKILNKNIFIKHRDAYLERDTNDKTGDKGLIDEMDGNRQQFNDKLITPLHRDAHMAVPVKSMDSTLQVRLRDRSQRQTKNSVRTPTVVTHLRPRR